MMNLLSARIGYLEEPKLEHIYSWRYRSNDDKQPASISCSAIRILIAWIPWNITDHYAMVVSFTGFQNSQKVQVHPQPHRSILGKTAVHTTQTFLEKPWRSFA